MKFKNTFYNWLTNRFILIIRTEENFAIKNTFRYTHAKMLIVATALFLLIFALSVYLISTVLAKFFNPQYAQLQTAKKAIVLSSKVDSLVIELERKDKFINQFKMLISGTEVKQDKPELKAGKNQYTNNNILSSDLTYQDSLLRAKFEQDDAAMDNLSERIYKFEGISFFVPCDGIVKLKFNPEKGIRGVSITTVKAHNIYSMVDGVVIYRGFEKEKNVIIITSQQLSISAKYVFDGKLIPDEGNVLRGGDVIGIAGGESISEVYFETWYQDRVVNPEYLVKF